MTITIDIDMLSCVEWYDYYTRVDYRADYISIPDIPQISPLRLNKTKTGRFITLFRGNMKCLSQKEWTSSYVSMIEI